MTRRFLFYLVFVSLALSSTGCCGLFRNFVYRIRNCGAGCAPAYGHGAESSYAAPSHVGFATPAYSGAVADGGAVSHEGGYGGFGGYAAPNCNGCSAGAPTTMPSYAGGYAGVPTTPGYGGAAGIPMAQNYGGYAGVPMVPNYGGYAGVPTQPPTGGYLGAPIMTQPSHYPPVSGKVAGAK